ncbi:MAG: L-serine ammonia-lyase, iron-sulfur-dependent, subunit alpha [Clostridiales bacterium]|nr:L-serine ammonia-lyase, iron-sulfur-dependent, subunit alpha [Clostridiales bacterium]
MTKDHPNYNAYIRILKEELVPAMGCTEPIALAYCAAKARQVLGVLPDRVLIQASGSIIKNVKSVIVPNTNHMKGIPAAAAAGIVAGDASRQLEVIASVTDEQIEEMRAYLERTPITVEHVDNGLTFEIAVTVSCGSDWASVRIVNYHTNIVHIERNGEVLLDIPVDGEGEAGLTDRSCLNLKDILDFAESVDIADVKSVLDRQIQYNSAIAEEGLRGNYGSNIGSVLLRTYGDDNVMVRAKAMAAAGSDARMNGCEMPVVINSGSGNQGMTTSLPVIEYAKELKVSDETLYRALTLANLTTIHQKTSIGRLSAFCGAVSAGAGAGAGIAYLMGSDLDGISHTVANAIATTGGIVCDGAKASCASKIATAVEAGILGYNMHVQNQDFQPDDGLVGDTPEETITNIGRLGKEGMKGTNEEIIKIMVGE